MMPEDAVTAPRFGTGHHEDSFNPDPRRKRTLEALGGLTLNDQINKDVRTELANRGHKVRTTSEPIAYPVMLYVAPDTGIMYAAGDPRTGRHAAALESDLP